MFSFNVNWAEPGGGRMCCFAIYTRGNICADVVSWVVFTTVVTTFLFSTEFRYMSKLLAVKATDNWFFELFADVVSSKYIDTFR